MTRHSVDIRLGSAFAGSACVWRFLATAVLCVVRIVGIRTFVGVAIGWSGFLIHAGAGYDAGYRRIPLGRTKLSVAIDRALVLRLHIRR